MTWIAGSVVVASGLWLVGFALAIFVTPARARRFLGRFASSARAHYTEQALRLVAGLAFVLFAPQMRYSKLFVAFGWLLVVTAAALLLVPWRWHHRFGRWAIPLAIEYMKLLALGSLALGVFILVGVF